MHYDFDIKHLATVEIALGQSLASAIKQKHTGRSKLSRELAAEAADRIRAAVSDLHFREEAQQGRGMVFGNVAKSCRAKLRRIK